MGILSARLFSLGFQTEPTFGLITDEWLTGLSKTVKYSTRSAYLSITEKYIPQALRTKPISRVTAEDLDRVLDEAEHPPGKGTLSASLCALFARLSMRYSALPGKKGLKLWYISTAAAGQIPPDMKSARLRRMNRPLWNTGFLSI